MTPDTVVTIARDALITMLLVSAPMLISGLLVGLIISILQAITQVHEMTLTFIPKILVMIIVFLALLPWMLIRMVEYTATLFDLITKVGGNG